jgi:DNA-binding NarL/FixJ family response regulator
VKAEWVQYPADFYCLNNIAVSCDYRSDTGMPASLPSLSCSVIELDRVRAARRRQPGAVFSGSKFAMLSGRQRDVLALIVQGQSNKEIARTLGLAEGTVKIHVAALFVKLGIRRRAAAPLAVANIFGNDELLGRPA